MFGALVSEIDEFFSVLLQIIGKAFRRPMQSFVIERNIFDWSRHDLNDIARMQVLGIAQFHNGAPKKKNATAKQTIQASGLFNFFVIFLTLVFVVSLAALTVMAFAFATLTTNQQSVFDLCKTVCASSFSGLIGLGVGKTV